MLVWTPRDVEIEWKSQVKKKIAVNVIIFHFTISGCFVRRPSGQARVRWIHVNIPEVWKRNDLRDSGLFSVDDLPLRHEWSHFYAFELRNCIRNFFFVWLEAHQVSIINVSAFDQRKTEEILRNYTKWAGWCERGIVICINSNQCVKCRRLFVLDVFGECARFGEIWCGF